MMLTVLYCSRGSVSVAAVTYGLAIHLRIYPVIYALPLMVFSEICTIGLVQVNVQSCVSDVRLRPP